MTNRVPNFSVSSEKRNTTFTGRATIPIAFVDQIPVQREGSLVYDPSRNNVFYSNGMSWAPATPGSNPVQSVSANGSGTVQLLDPVMQIGPNVIVKDLTQGSGITLINNPNSITVTNSAPDQVVTLTAGANVTITGTYPNFTISSSGVSGNDLASTLMLGNFTGGNDIIMTTGDEVVGETNVTVRGVDTAGATGGDVTVRGGNDTTGLGGDVLISGGDTTTGGGMGGDVTIRGGNDNTNGSGGDVIISAGVVDPMMGGMNGNIILNSSGYIDILGVRHLPASSVTTTDSTTTLIKTISLSIADTVYSIKFRLLARSSTGLGATYDYNISFKRDSGTTVTQIGIPFIELHTEVPAWQVTVTPGTSEVQIFVKGQASTNINWSVTSSIQVIS